MNTPKPPLLTAGRLLVAGILALAVIFVGCGGSKLIPRDLKDFVAADLKTPRRNVEFTQPFRSTITLKIAYTDIAGAKKAERDLINSTVAYFQRDGVSDFINDTIVFVVRLEVNPDINLKYFTVAEDLRLLTNGEMILDEFIDRCRREENWQVLEEREE